MTKFVSTHGYKVWREGDDYVTQAKGHAGIFHESSHAQAITEYIVAREHDVKPEPHVIHALAHSGSLPIPSVTFCGEVRHEKDLREDGVACVKCLKVALEALKEATS